MEIFLQKFFTDLILGIDFIGVAVAVWGTIEALLAYLIVEIRRKKSDETKYMEKLRANFGQKLLLGMEFFLAADLIKAVVSPTYDSLGKLASIVAIRVVLSYFLNKEISEIHRKWGSKVWKDVPKEV